METRRELIVELAVRADELGYARFTLAEGWGHDATVLLAEIALRTARIRIGTGVLNIWGRSPATLAMAAASLDQLSDGRFELGLGAGSPALAQGWHEQLFADPVARLAAVTDQVRGLLDGQRLRPTEGSSMRTLRLAVQPRHRIPIHLAALGPRALGVAAELADGWFPFLMPRSGLTAALASLRSASTSRICPNPVLACPCVPAAVHPDPAVAREVACWWVAFYLTSMGPIYRDVLHRTGFAAMVDAVLAANPDGRTTVVPAAAEPLINELVLHGDGPAARGQLDQWCAAGADEPVIVLPPNRPREEMMSVLEALSPDPHPAEPRLP